MLPRILLNLLYYVLKLTNVVVFFTIIFFLLPLVHPYIGNLDKVRIVQRSLVKEEQVTNNIKRSINKFVPTEIDGFDVTRVGLIVLFMMVSSGIGKLNYRVTRRIVYLHHSDEYHELLHAASLRKGTDKKKLKTIKHKLEELKTADSKSRKQLIIDFAKLKSELEGLRRNLAFLSLDIVDSTGLKADEDPTIYSADFYHYNEMVQKILEKYNCAKFTVTPDGIMACFDDSNNAFQAGKEILIALKTFNAEVKSIKNDFKLRAGLNSGSVMYDMDEPLEHIADRTIDIAGHMQKDAKPNTIYISELTYNTLPTTNGIKVSDLEIDGERVCVWEFDE